MAAKPSSSSSPGLLKLEEQLTCPVCLDLYTNPKTLPCLHSFCEACIERFPQDKEGETYYLSCPTCRHRTELPGGGAGAFPVAFTLNNFIEVHSLLKKVSDPQQVTCDNCNAANATGYCKDCSKFLCQKCMDAHKIWAPIAHHQMMDLSAVAASAFQLLSAKQEATPTCSSHGKPLEIFCETCDEVICQHCTVRIHRDHEYDLVNDSYPKHCQKLEECLSPVKGKMEDVKKVLSKIAEREGEIRERGEGVLEEIHEMVEEMMIVLRQSERKLIEQAKNITDAKLEVLSGQAKSAQISLSLLEHIEDYVEQSVKTGTPQQVLRSKKQMMERMSEVTTQINVEELEPKEKADLKLIKDDKIIELLHHIGDIIFYSSSALQHCKFKFGVLSIYVSDEIKGFISLSMEAPDSSLVSVPVSSLKCSLLGKGDNNDAEVTTTSHPAVYNILFPVNEFDKFEDIQKEILSFELQLKLPDAPPLVANVFTEYNVPFALDKLYCVSTLKMLNSPWGVAVSDDGHVVVTENNGNCVTILDNEGKKVKSFGGKEGSGNVQFSKPRGVAITPDNFILVCDNHRIQKISMDGDCIASVGGYGSGPLQFNAPSGIAISPITGQVYIADRCNHRIQVLNPDLTFSHSFGSEGSKDEQLKRPHYVAINSRGNIFITETDSPYIKVFSPYRYLLWRNKIPEKETYPVGVAVSSYDVLCKSSTFEMTLHDVYFVTESNGNIGRCYMEFETMEILEDDADKKGELKPLKSAADNNNTEDIRHNRQGKGIAVDKKGYLYVCGVDCVSIYKPII